MQTNHYLSKHLSIWRDVERLMVQTTQVMPQSSRYQKYNLGQDFHQLAIQLLSLLIHGINQKPRHCHWVGRLVLLNDKPKLNIQADKTLKEFVNSSLFKQLARLIVPVPRTLSLLCPLSFYSFSL